MSQIEELVNKKVDAMIVNPVNSSIVHSITDMAVGNIIGSVSFNILSVVGVASAITPIQNAWTPFAIDYVVMIGLGVLLWVFLKTHRKIVRYEGAILLIIYCLYIAKTLMV